MASFPPLINCALQLVASFPPLIGMLKYHIPSQAKTVAVGCNDIGMFITHHSQGRYIVNDLRGKELVMRHMANPDPDVQKQALLCVQKLMLTKEKLEFLGSS